MRKFCRHIALFLLPLIAAGFLILNFEPERVSLWNSYPDDCDNRGQWIEDVIFDSPEPIDIAFLGSSHTINGIQDSLAGTLLSRNQNLRAVNLGYCRFGPEMNLIVLRDLLEHKKPRLIVIELNETVITSSHPMYPYFSSNEDLIPDNFFNQNVPANFYHGFLTRLTEIRNTCFNISVDEIRSGYNRFGYRGYPSGAIPDLHVRDHVKVASQGFIRRTELSYSFAWHERIKNLCNAHDCKVCYVYLPAFHEALQPLEGISEFERYGPVFIPGQDLRQKEYWRDQDHLNDLGSNQLTVWLCEQIKNTMLLKKPD